MSLLSLVIKAVLFVPVAFVAFALACVLAGMLRYYSGKGKYDRQKNLFRHPMTMAFFASVKRKGMLDVWELAKQGPKKDGATYPPLTFIGPDFKGSPALMITDADAIKQVLTSDMFPKQLEIYEPLELTTGTGLLLAQGERWKRNRMNLNPIFHYRALSNFIPGMHKSIKKWVTQMEAKCRASPNGMFKQEAFDLMCSATMPMFINSVFGPDMNGEWMNDKWCYLATQKRGLRIIWLLLGKGVQWFPILWPANVRATRAEIEKKIKLLLAKRRGDLHITDKECPAQYDEEDTSADLVGLLMRIGDETGKPVLTDREIVDESLTFLVAGHDTTSTSLSWTLYFLVQRPEIVKRLQAEVDGVLSSGEELTDAHLASLPLVRACLNESIRLRPPIPQIPKTTAEDTEICGVKVYKGTCLMIDVLGVHTSEEHWPNAQTYNPDRWFDDASNTTTTIIDAMTKAKKKQTAAEQKAEEDQKEKEAAERSAKRRHPFAFVPFSAGKRSCIGKNYSMHSATVVLAHVIRHFNISAREGETGYASVSTSMLPRELKVQLTIRDIPQ